MRVIVCGSRDWTDREAIADRLFDLPPGSTIVHGAAKGADRIAGQEGQKLGHLIEEHPADWRDGKRAGFFRNERMAKLGADLCIAFWDGRSKGTSMMVDLADEHGIPLELVVDGAPHRAERSPNAERTEIHGLDSEQNTVGGGQVGCG